MAEASIDIRVYRKKELLSVDMAELIDSASFGSCVIQGCEVTISNGILNVADGRLLLGGRLGVVTGGSIPIPTTLSGVTVCYLYAVCDLSNAEKPFYFKLMSDAEYSEMSTGIPEGEDYRSDFNVVNGIGFLSFGKCTVDPATGLVSDWQYSADADGEHWGVAQRGWERWMEMKYRVRLLEGYIKDYMIRVAVNTGSHTCAANTGTVNYDYTLPDGTIPAGYKALDVRCATTQDYQFYCWMCDFADDTRKVVRVRIQKRSGTGGTIWPWLLITCVRDIT